MPKTIQITPKQYAEWQNISTQYVHRLLKDKKESKLKKVVRVVEFGRFYVLEVNSKEYSNAVP